MGFKLSPKSTEKLSSRSIRTMSGFLAGLTFVGALALALVWMLDLMTTYERLSMAATIASNAMMVWVLSAWAKQTERLEGMEPRSDRMPTGKA